jgi:hypothetical protein
MTIKQYELSLADWVFQAASSITQVHETDIYDDAKANGNLGSALSRAVLVYTSMRELEKTDKHENERGQPLDFIRSHVNKYGPLSPEAIYYIAKLSEVCSFPEMASKIGREKIRLHPQQTKRAEFLEWAKHHISKGAAPQNVAAIKRITGFKKSWGVDDTIKKWWRSIEDAPPLKPGATRT